MQRPDPTEVLRRELACSDERLDNGLRLLMIEDHRVPATAVSLYYNVGSRNEVIGRTGFAHLFEHLMFEGSRNVERGEHVSAVTRLGGSFNGVTSNDCTHYFETIPSHGLELILWLEADRMGGLLDAVTQENLENQRAVVKNERMQTIDNVPCGTAGERMFAHLFPLGHPYHHLPIGSMADIEAATLDDVHAFFNTYYAPNNAVLSIVGDIDADQVREWVQGYFGGIAPSPDVQPAPDGTVPLTIGGEIREVVPDQVAVSHCNVAFRAPPLGTPAFDALAEGCRVLNTGRASRFERRLRRGDKQIVLGAGLGLQTLIGGVNVISGGFQPAPGVSLEEAEAAYYDAIMELVTDPVTDDELERAHIETEVFGLGFVQSISAKASNIGGGALYFDDPAVSLRAVERSRSITAADISRAAEEVFRADNRVVLTFVPRDAEVQAA